MHAELTRGTRLGPYRIEALLGEGAMGKVWRAEHVELGRAVAIKALKPAAAADASLVTRFLAEARAVNLIRHENIIECEGLVQADDGPAYVVMELLEGRTLGTVIEEGKLAPARAARIAAQIADALEAAHAQGIVHRDLKPENVFLIRRAGTDDYVKVLDFGIARLRPDLGAIAATETGALVGTPAYMAPEQVRGDKATPAADVYALGVVLFQMLTGALPLTAANMPLMFVATLTEQPRRADAVEPGVPRALADLIERALDKEPSVRPASMAAFREELLAAVGVAASDAPAVRASRAAAPDALAETVTSGVGAAATAAPAGRSRAPVVAGVVGVAALAAGGAWLATRGSAAAAPPDAAIVAKISEDAARPDAAIPPDAIPPDAAVPIDAANKRRSESTPSDPVLANALAAIKKRYLAGINTCWEMAHKIAPDLPRTAKFHLKMRVAETGKPEDIQIGELKYDHRGVQMNEWQQGMLVNEVPDCIDGTLGRWYFPPADHAVEIDTTVTLKSRH